MPRKRTPTDEEIAVLAEQFCQLWRPGEVLRPWFRQHRDMLLDLVHGDWSWASVGQALTKAGIIYGTGKPWTAKWLQSDFSRAQMPLKGYRRRSSRAETPVPSPTAVPMTTAAQATQSPTTPPLPTPPPPTAGSIPRFKPASFRIQDPPPTLTDADRAEIEHNHRLTFGLPVPKEPS